MVMIKDFSNLFLKVILLTIPCSYKLIKRRHFEWDLVGPLISILLLCIIMTQYKEYDEKYFFTSFIILTCGSLLSYLNTLFLKLKMTFFENLNVFTLCSLPIFFEDLIIYQFDI